MGSDKQSKWQEFYAIVKQVPHGKVASYGQIATLAGYYGQARQVGYALHAVPSDDIPWHRIINAQGKISLNLEMGGAVQRKMLEDEGIIFSEAEVISLKKYQWVPQIDPEDNQI
ncbi:MAG: MGMT family protein [Candidatus Marinimicrobia bacterium]|nr:MGMT family protein [Candidatus Neomarinimicrobiota bacterium]MCF7850212.1 MGMT family protein [Candidatus Neomarinimicrobiota bacterium]MCF7903746.1 MGMT family protein [Candidatus Neomarinimicrobiota bacterium]